MLDIPLGQLGLIVVGLAILLAIAVKMVFGQGGGHTGLPPMAYPEPDDAEQLQHALAALPVAEAYVMTFGDWPTGTNYLYAPRLAPPLTREETVGAREIYRIVRDGELIVPSLITHKVLQAKGTMRPAVFLGELRSFISLYEDSSEM